MERNTIYKKEFATQLARESGISVSEAERILNNMIGLLIENLKSGNAVVLTGLGKFYLAESKRTVAINPQTGQKITVTPKTKLKFKASNTLKF